MWEISCSMNHLINVLARVVMTINGVAPLLAKACRRKHLIKLITLAGFFLTEKKGTNVQVLVLKVAMALRPRQTYRLTKKHS